MSKELTTLLEEGKLDTIDLLKDELKMFFNANEPQQLKNLNNPKTKERKLLDIINKITSSVKFPEVSDLIDNISLTVYYYDLTWNYFKDEKLLKEFKKKEIMKKNEIDSIVKLKDAFEAKQPQETQIKKLLFS